MSASQNKVNQSSVAQLEAPRFENGKPLLIEYQVIVNPVVLGQGRVMFDGLKKKLDLKLTKTRTFNNGKVFPVLRADDMKPVAAVP